MPACARSISAGRIMAEALLALDGVRAGYGDAVVLDGIAFEVLEGGSLALLGRNGVGKTTLLLTIMGFTRVSRGTIVWRGRDITRVAPHGRARDGLGWVAQEREIFPSLNVEENLTVAARPGPLDAGGGLHPVPAAQGAARQQRQSSLRRRAADAGDRTRIDDKSCAAPARRAARGPGADHRRGIDRGDPADDLGRRHGFHPGRAACRGRIVVDRGGGRVGAWEHRASRALATTCCRIKPRSIV